MLHEGHRARRGGREQASCTPDGEAVPSRSGGGGGAGTTVWVRHDHAMREPHPPTCCCRMCLMGCPAGRPKLVVALAGEGVRWCAPGGPSAAWKGTQTISEH